MNRGVHSLACLHPKTREAQKLPIFCWCYDISTSSRIRPIFGTTETVDQRKIILNWEGPLHTKHPRSVLSKVGELWLARFFTHAGIFVVKAKHNFILLCHNPRVWQMDRRIDGRTDGRTAFSWLDRDACNACSAVKNACSKAEIAHAKTVEDDILI